MHTEKDIEHLSTEEERREELLHNPKTRYLEVFPKTILNRVTSPDLPMGWSMNPYQGCEHGCIYCYARNSHEYWDYSSGAAFEQNIMVKKSAPELLRNTLLGKNWKPELIVLAGNTDIYQPAERHFKITRQCLSVFADLQHPVGLITKNVLIERDLDILAPMAQNNLVVVTLSLTTLREELKRVMEPRTSSVRQVLRAITTLSKAGIPVNVNTAPIIPGLNDDEIFDLIQAVAEAGAQTVSYIVVRLNGHNGKLFEDWVTKNFPDRAQKVLNRIKDLHAGRLNDTDYGRRMKGEGRFAELIKQQVTLARKKFLRGRSIPPLNYSLFIERKRSVLQNGQMELF